MTEKTNLTESYDFIAIGVGPMNLGLACLTEPIKELNGIFLDQRSHFDWHPGMLLQDTTLQIPFIADLVTLADPTSPFSFLKYLKEQGRIYSFYIRENFLVLRNEFNLYCQWAISKLRNIYFDTEVVGITYSKEQNGYAVSTRSTRTGECQIFYSKKLILGTGHQPYIPHCCKNIGQYAIHSSSYLNHKPQLQAKKSITIIGSGQSAAEIFYDLLQDIDTAGYELHWITRSPRFFPLEYSKLTLEMTSPEYVDYFFDLPAEKKDFLNQHQKHLYKGINQELIANIFDLIYTKKLTHTVNIGLRTNCEVQDVQHDTALEKLYLDIHQTEQDKHYSHQTEGLILATGYSYRLPKFVEGIRDRIRWDKKGRYAVHRNYTIDHDGTDIFVQNAELHTHGFVSPDLGMASYRNSYIIRELTGTEYYPIESRISTQTFGVSEAEEVQVRNSVQKSEC